MLFEEKVDSWSGGGKIQKDPGISFGGENEDIFKKGRGVCHKNTRSNCKDFPIYKAGTIWVINNDIIRLCPWVCTDIVK